MKKYINIKKICFSVIAIILFQAPVVAQAQEDGRTLKTRVADLLVQFPAKDTEDFDRLMIETVALGQPGIIEMAHMFAPRGQGNNTNFEYALSGLSFYVMQEKNEKLRLMMSNAFIQALDEVSLIGVKSFFISQLQIVGKEEAVETLRKYLDEESLCEISARALVNIKTLSAQQTLLDALSSATGSCQYALIAALGDMRSKNAVNDLSNLVVSSDSKTKSLALYALANIGDPSSEALLADEAKAVEFKMNDTNATSAYFLWAQRMIENGNKKPVEKLTTKLLRKLDEDDQVHSKAVALKLLIEAKGGGASRQIVNAATDENPEIRAAALRFAAPLKTDKITKQLLKQLKKADNPVKVDLISFFGDTRNIQAYSAIEKYSDSEDPVVRIAAIRAYSKIGKKKAIPKLLELIETRNGETIEVIKSALLTTGRDDVILKVATALSGVNSPKAKVALLEVLASRRAVMYSDTVFALTNSENSQIRFAAMNALQHISTEEDLPLLNTLLKSGNNEKETALIQAAIIKVLGDENKSNSTNYITQQMELVPADKKYIYYNILVSIATDEALNAIVHEYQNGNSHAKKYAINAMKNWKGSSACMELLKIARSSRGLPHFDQVLEAYVQQVNASDETKENKYLQFREAMEIANTVEQKRVILNQIGRNPSLPALFYVAKFLEDGDVKKEAASAVVNMIQANDTFYGEKLRNVLEKTITSLEGEKNGHLKKAVRKHLEEMPEGPGFKPLFNEKDRAGWKGLVGNPLKRAEMDPRTLERQQKEADEKMRESWKVEDGKLIFTGEGENISTVKKYGDFEMYIDWKIEEGGDAGIYLRGTPQVQIWDPAFHGDDAPIGSGGLFNNKINESKPLKVADNPVGEWNNFHIIMEGDGVTVYLNGELVVNNVVLENYWNRDETIFPEDYIELQAHGSKVEYRDIYIREIPRSKPFELSEEEIAEGFEVLFDGSDLDKWQGNKTDYIIENGDIVFRPEQGRHEHLFTNEQYDDFVFRFEFKLTPGANNGLGIRGPLVDFSDYSGIELQILDNTADVYKDLEDYQYHGSVYGIIPAKRGYLNPVGEWNYQEVIVCGPNVKVILNGEVIVDGNVVEAAKGGKNHSRLQHSTGNIAFLSHGSVVKFRNIRVKRE